MRLKNFTGGFSATRKRVESLLVICLEASADRHVELQALPDDH